MRQSLDVELLDKRSWGNEELHGAEKAAVVGEVAGAAAREHVLVEGIIHAHDERVSRSGMQEVRNVESEGGIAFPCVFSSELAIHPDRGGVIHGYKLNSNGRATPALGDIEIAPVPSDAAILSQ